MLRFFAGLLPSSNLYLEQLAQCWDAGLIQNQYVWRQPQQHCVCVCVTNVAWTNSVVCPGPTVATFAMNRVITSYYSDLRSTLDDCTK